MASPALSLPAVRTFLQDKVLLGRAPRQYARELLNPFDVLAALVLVPGVFIVAWRFLFGLGSVTNLSQSTPWGVWIGFDMLCGVALAAGGYTLSAAVYMFGLERFRPVVRPAILTGFLGYLFAVCGLLCDLGQPWRIVYPIVYSHGVTSVMFEVGWCVALYLTVLFLEFSPALFDWLGLKGISRRVHDMTLGLISLGVVLSTLHQSSLGALFLTAPQRLHPLWYSPFLPVQFFVSSIVAGLAMVIVESGLSHRAFRHRLDPRHPHDLDAMTVSLGRAAAVALFAYVFLRLLGFAEAGRPDLLATGYGALWLGEVALFFVLPCLLMGAAARRGSATGVRVGAAAAVLGVVLNRVNVSMVAFNWAEAERYIPSAAEILVSLTLVTAGVLSFRFIVNRMAILGPEVAEARS
jgi:Ni/Fe-hydrogenase subunit HybB-like protein